MHHILIETLHVFVVIMMAFFIIMCTMAASGSFDNWGKRYKTKKPRRLWRNHEDA
ncbi:hypothetical protein [Mucilaginibacter sp. L196]|uniref:hypothetical protein n=1 Tax=Mucilaginibacter sp. L196 TaxID=1641870 RepID=UPI00131BDD28|nr:hypothetical protein [Mucilaginibacter sp. L196]